MENLRISIETWGGNVSAEQLVSSIEVAVRQLTGAKTVTVEVEGSDSNTALSVCTTLTKTLKPEECRVTRYNAVFLKVRNPM